MNVIDIYEQAEHIEQLFKFSRIKSLRKEQRLAFEDFYGKVNEEFARRGKNPISKSVLRKLESNELYIPSLTLLLVICQVLKTSLDFFVEYLPTGYWKSKNYFAILKYEDIRKHFRVMHHIAKRYDATSFSTDWTGKTNDAIKKEIDTAILQAEEINKRDFYVRRIFIIRSKTELTKVKDITKFHYENLRDKSRHLLKYRYLLEEELCQSKLLNFGIHYLEKETLVSVVNVTSRKKNQIPEVQVTTMEEDIRYYENIFSYFWKSARDI